MSRSTKLLGRVLRNLKRHNLRENESQDPEIYGELTSAQDNIISTTQPERIITLEFEEGVEYYPLTTDEVTDPELNTYKNNISAVKVVKQPSEFLYKFEVVSNTEFIRKIEGEYPSSVGGLASVTPAIFSFIKTAIPLTGDKDGVNTIFTIPESTGIVKFSEKIYLNGVLQIRGTDYEISGTQVTILHSIIPEETDTLVGNWIRTNPYIKAASLSGDKNGTNRVFRIPTLSLSIVKNSEEIFLNGVLQVRDVDYSIEDKIVTILHNVLPIAEDDFHVNWITDDAVDALRQPVIGTVIGKKLKVYPIPGLVVDGVEIELFVYQKSSTGQIDENTEPEVEAEYDKALEFFATAQFLSGKERQEYDNLFEREIKRMEHLTHKSKGTMNREPIAGWW